MRLISPAVTMPEMGEFGDIFSKFEVLFNETEMTDFLNEVDELLQVGGTYRVIVECMELPIGRGPRFNAG